MEDYVTIADDFALFSRFQIQINRSLPIRSSELGMLIYISRNNNVKPNEISQFFYITKPSVTAMINRMLNEKYIEKLPSKTDKRSYQVTLTTAGESLVEFSKKEYIARLKLIESKLGRENFTQFVTLLHEVNQYYLEELK